MRPEEDANPKAFSCCLSLASAPLTPPACLPVPPVLLLSAYVLRLLPRVRYLLLVIAVALVQAGAFVVSSAWQSGGLWDGRRVLSQGQATVRALKCPVLLLLGAMLA